MIDRPNPLPKARQHQLIIKELTDETLVYDLESDQAHCLNATAALVWKYCDGKKSIDEITASMAEKLGATVDERVVWLALDQLEQFKLLAEVPRPPNRFVGLNRRQLMRTLGVAAIGLPIVVSIIAPPAAAAVSCANKTPSGGMCNGGGNCCSGTCCGPGVPGCPNNTCL